MPFGIRKVGTRYEVYEKAGGKHPGKKFGKSSSKAAAQRHIRAIEANSHG